MCTRVPTQARMCTLVYLVRVITTGCTLRVVCGITTHVHVRVLYRYFFARGEIRFYVFLSMYSLLSFGFVVECYLAVVL